MIEFTRIPHKIEMILQADATGFYETWHGNISGKPIFCTSDAEYTTLLHSKEH